MNIRAEIRRILSEELPSLANPLDKAADAVSLSTSGLQDKVDGLKKRAKKEKDDLNTNINAKRKAIMVPQSNSPEIERQRRQYADMEVKDLEAKLKTKDEEGEEVDALVNDLGGLKGSLSALEKERDQLHAMLASMNVGMSSDQG